MRPQRSFLRARRHVPQSYDRVETAGSECAPIRTERHRHHNAVVSGERAGALIRSGRTNRRRAATDDRCGRDQASYRSRYEASVAHFSSSSMVARAGSGPAAYSLSLYRQHISGSPTPRKIRVIMNRLPRVALAVFAILSSAAGSADLCSSRAGGPRPDCPARGQSARCAQMSEWPPSPSGRKRWSRISNPRSSSHSR